MFTVHNERLILFYFLQFNLLDEYALLIYHRLLSNEKLMCIVMYT